MAANPKLFLGNSSIKKSEPDAMDIRLIKNVSKIVSGSKGLVLANDTSHSGYVNKNNRKYTADSFASKFRTMFTPHPKPVLKSHNMVSGLFGPDQGFDDAIGRVYDSVFVPGNFKRADGQTADGVLKSGLFIPEGPEAEKVRSGIHLTTSVGFSRDTAVCSICGFDHMASRMNRKQADEDLEECEHVPGRIYDKKLCYWNVDVREFGEVSTVTDPADVMSMFTAMQEVDSTSYAEMTARDALDIEYTPEGSLNYVCQDINYGKTFTVKKPESDVSDSKQPPSKEVIMDELIKILEPLTDAVKDLKNKIEGLDKVGDAVKDLEKKISDLNKPADEPQDQGGSDAATGKEDKLDVDALKKVIADTVKEAVKTEVAEAVKAIKPAADAAGDGGDDNPPADEPGDGEKPETDVAKLQKELDEMKDRVTALNKENEELKAGGKDRSRQPGVVGGSRTRSLSRV